MYTHIPAHIYHESMVILEAAAITAGSVAAYKGGKAAIIATAKTVKSRLSLSSKERTRDEICQSRKEERAERFAKVNEYRESVTRRGGGGGGACETSGGGFRWTRSDDDGSRRGRRDGLHPSNRGGGTSSAADAARTKRSTTKSSTRSWW
jgi:hypothetical protein